MFELTSSERKALVFLVSVLLVGMILQYFLRNSAFKKVFSQNIAATRPPQSAVSSRKINLNNASTEDLISLPGIGPALASRIVKYRTEYGPFQSTDDVARVPGIGKKLLQRLVPYIDSFSQK